jgi:colanic acid/amylovoran biosynthesis protein
MAMGEHRILLRGLPSLNNYGTGMMGLITIDRLSRTFDGPVRFLCDFEPTTDIPEVGREAGIDPERVSLERVARPPAPSGARLSRLATRLGRLLGANQAAGCDLVVFLGGDDISEYYGTDAWQTMLKIWQWAGEAPVVLLGQTIGPFALAPNRMAARWLLPRAHIFPRDLWCTAYLKTEFGLVKQVQQSTDLAYADLPLQHRLDIRDEVLRHYGLAPDGYATMIVSGLGAKYYTPDIGLFYGRHAEVVTAILQRPDMAGRKLCLLAHTFGYYGNEAVNIRAVHERLASDVASRVVLVPDRVLQTRARFILGHGLFTVTGRMHPAVSTFQMGKPAISLAYSKKYEGVIGTMLGRSDLIIDADDSRLWETGAIVGQVLDRVDYAMANHARLTAEIRAAIAVQKASVDATFATIRGLVNRP